jgi:F-type H+-transporting ATPase subunit a
MISLAAEPIAHIGNFPITNTLTDTLVVDALLIAAAWYTAKKISLVPSFFQATVELTLEAFYGLTQSVSENKAMLIFPFMMTFFLFIIVSNLSGLFPIITAIGFFHGKNFTPLFRSASTDLNTTLALALVSLIATHTMSIYTLGLKQYIRRFISYKPLELYTGLLELVSELTKIISFSFRLFGNIFVGEVILGLLTAISAFLLPIPLIFYEMFVGTVQAVIFSLLTMAFMALFTAPHGVEE